MATKSPKSNREKAAAIDARIYGVEPKYDREMTKVELIDALNFYNSFARKDLMKSVLVFMKNAGYSKNHISDFSLCEDWRMDITSAKLAAIVNKNNSSVLSKGALTRLRDNVEICIERGVILKNLEAIKNVTVTVPIDPNMKKAGIIMSEIDGMIDEQMLDRNFTFDAYKFLQEQNANLIVAKMIADNYTGFLNELQIASGKSDEQLSEGYAHIKKVDMKKTIAFITNIIDSANKFKQNEKIIRVRKPRKLKVKSADQLTKSVKYCKSFTELNLISISPTEIVGASSIWIYNTKYRKLGVYVSAPNQTFSVKGTTILNINEELSVSKTLRKPEVQLNEFAKATKVTLRKFLENITGKAASLNGRLNEDTIILKAFK